MRTLPLAMLRGQCEGVPEESEEIRQRAEKSRVDFLLLVRDLKDEEDQAEEGEGEEEALQVSLMAYVDARDRGCAKKFRP